MNVGDFVQIAEHYTGKRYKHMHGGRKGHIIRLDKANKFGNQLVRVRDFVLPDRTFAVRMSEVTVLEEAQT